MTEWYAAYHGPLPIMAGGSEDDVPDATAMIGDAVVLEPGATDASSETNTDEHVEVNVAIEAPPDDDSGLDTRLAALETSVGEMREKFAEMVGILEGMATASETVSESESVVQEPPMETVIDSEQPAAPGGEEEAPTDGGEKHAGMWI